MTILRGYSTKHALTTGITAVEVEYTGKSYYAYARGAYGAVIRYKLGRDFFENKRDAEHNARERAQRKLRRLEQQGLELRKLVTKPRYGRGAS